MRFMTNYHQPALVRDHFFSSMDRALAEFWDLAEGDTTDEKILSPACDVTESEEGFLLSFDVPGLRKEDIKIEIKDNALEVSGERKHEKATDKKAKVQRFEKSYGFFKRSFALPNTVDSEKIEASYDDGVLEISLRKNKTTKSRTVEVQSGRKEFMNRWIGADKKTAEAAIQDENEADDVE